MTDLVGVSLLSDGLKELSPLSHGNERKVLFLKKKMFVRKIHKIMLYKHEFVVDRLKYN